MAVLLILATAWIAVIIIDWTRSKPAKDKPSGEDEEPDRRELFARANGRQIALGSLADIHRLEIGTGAQASVPLVGKDILPCHATLTRDGDVFCIRNRSGTPIVANKIPVPPRRRARLVLPAELVLGDESKVHLFVRRVGDDQEGSTS